MTRKKSIEELNKFRKHLNKREPELGDKMLFSLSFLYGGRSYWIIPTGIECKQQLRKWTQIWPSECRTMLMTAFRWKGSIYIDFCSRFAGEFLYIPKVDEYTAGMPTARYTDLLTWYSAKA